MSDYSLVKAEVRQQRSSHPRQKEIGASKADFRSHAINRCYKATMTNTDET